MVKGPGDSSVSKSRCYPAAWWPWAQVHQVHVEVERESMQLWSQHSNRETGGRATAVSWTQQGQLTWRMHHNSNGKRDSARTWGNGRINWLLRTGLWPSHACCDTHVCTHMHIPHAHPHTCIQTHMHAHACKHTHAHTCVYTHTHTSKESTNQKK